MYHEQILQLLRESGGYISGEEMSRRLGITRSAVWKVIRALREQGYQIDSSTRLGYRLVSGPDILSAAEIRAVLGPHPWLENLVVLPEVDSTNNYLRKLAAAGAPAGTVVTAGMQTGGRGRQGRSFDSPAGLGVYFSVLLRLHTPPEAISHLTEAVAVAACDALEAAAGLRPGIKWTNDLILQDRKLGGILTELSLELESGQTDYVVVGIGINCAQTPEQFPEEVRPMAVSLQMAAGHPVHRSAVVAELMRSLSGMADTLLPEKDRWLERYRADCITLGREVRVLRNGTVRQGRAEGLDPGGALLITWEDGSREAVFSGEVSVRGLYGYV